MFETTIRFLGGLLSAYAFSGEEVRKTLCNDQFILMIILKIMVDKGRGIIIVESYLGTGRP